MRKFQDTFETRKRSVRLVPELFLFFKIALYEVKASGLWLRSSTFRQPSTRHKNKLYKTFNC